MKVLLAGRELDEYLARYAADTDRRVRRGPHEAVGGNWRQLGMAQLEFLKGQGLLPMHTLLDIGCGTLRAGHLLVEYLAVGNYRGTDISIEAVLYARELIEQLGLAHKAPIVECTNGTFELPAIECGSVDWVLCHSVLNHLPPALVEDCFAGVAHVLREGGAFVFTYYKARGAGPERTQYSGFWHPQPFMEQLCVLHGLVYGEHAEYGHPRDQTMVVARKGDRK